MMSESGDARPQRLIALKVGNFKAFAETQRVPLRPITLVYGPNSAGKSSLVQALALAHEAEFGSSASGPNIDVHQTRVGGSAIDLGGFRQYVHRGQANRRVEWGAELDVSSMHRTGLDPRRRLSSLASVSLNISLGVEVDDLDRPRPSAVPQVAAMQIVGDDRELLRMSRRPRRIGRIAASAASGSTASRRNTRSSPNTSPERPRPRAASTTITSRIRTRSRRWCRRSSSVPADSSRRMPRSRSMRVRRRRTGPENPTGCGMRSEASSRNCWSPSPSRCRPRSGP
ncbi:AAA family ATPase [Sphingomonas aurantiaca]|uniref:AAA family ATPase n=1 Tax=Sphingomonas aurantiaca TaxID=185949 RepID=UPI002FE42437